MDPLAVDGWLFSVANPPVDGSMANTSPIAAPAEYTACSLAQTYPLRCAVVTQLSCRMSDGERISYETRLGGSVQPVQYRKRLPIRLGGVMCSQECEPIAADRCNIDRLGSDDELCWPFADRSTSFTRPLVVECDSGRENSRV